VAAVFRFTDLVCSSQHIKFQEAVSRKGTWEGGKVEIKAEEHSSRLVDC
jgi:hypothetical protein